MNTASSIDPDSPSIFPSSDFDTEFDKRTGGPVAEGTVSSKKVLSQLPENVRSKLQPELEHTKQKLKESLKDSPANGIKYVFWSAVTSAATTGLAYAGFSFTNTPTLDQTTVQSSELESNEVLGVVESHIKKTELEKSKLHACFIEREMPSSSSQKLESGTQIFRSGTRTRPT